MMLQNIINLKEVFWTNDNYERFQEKHILKYEDIKDSEDRFIRFAPYIKEVFKDTNENKGIIESQLLEIKNTKDIVEKLTNSTLLGKLYVKCDNELPISGSIKARGGIYEVLKYAETLAINNKILNKEDDYSILNSEQFKKFYSKYKIIVASTGNLGLSIGIIGSKLGFQVEVHMSKDAKEWKKEKLRSLGVKVIEHEQDYSNAVECARNICKEEKNSYFVDDENSKELFLGYSVAALRLKKQLLEKEIIVDEEHPLFVYLPCGVGGAPGGITFGLKTLFKDNVHCFFVEPTHSPAMLLSLITGKGDNISVQDFGIDNITEADGLAVGKASGFVSSFLKNDISGCYTVEDEKLYRLLYIAKNEENLKLEPSALAGFLGPFNLMKSQSGQKYIEKNNLKNKINNGTHIIWATGGNMVPTEIFNEYYLKGKDLFNKIKKM